MNRLSELIYLYLDGEATEQERQELFDALSNDPQLQREFYQALQLHRAIDYERGCIAPPSSMKEAVYAAIGIVPAPSLLERVLSLTSISAALSGITLGIVAWFALAPTPLPYQTDTEPLRAPAVQPPAAGSSPTIASAQTPSRILLKSTSPSTQPATDAQQEIPPSKLDNFDNLLVTRRHAVSSVSPMVRNSSHKSVGMVEAALPAKAAEFRSHLLLQGAYRGAVLATSTPAASMQNFSLMAFYRFDEYSSVGLELRRSPYTLNVAQSAGALSTVTLTSLSVAYMFIEPNVRIFGGMPYVQPAVGMTQLGPLTTLTAGLMFPISPSFQFNVGVDGSALVHSSQVASNVGIVLGLSLGVPLR